MVNNILFSVFYQKLLLILIFIIKYVLSRGLYINWQILQVYMAELHKLLHVRPEELSILNIKVTKDLTLL